MNRSWYCVRVESPTVVGTRSWPKNITFTAEEALIEEAREAARAENTTLNEQFRLRLEQYAHKRRAERMVQTVDRIRQYADTGGRQFTRDEMNERR